MCNPAVDICRSVVVSLTSFHFRLLVVGATWFHSHTLTIDTWEGKNTWNTPHTHTVLLRLRENHANIIFSPVGFFSSYSFKSYSNQEVPFTLRGLLTGLTRWWSRCIQSRRLNQSVATLNQFSLCSSFVLFDSLMLKLILIFLKTIIYLVYFVVFFT